MKKLNTKKATVLLLALLLPAVLVTPAFAGGLADSTLGAGLKNLINDVFLYLTILCPLAGGLMAVYFVIRWSMSDEQDGKLWEKRIKTAIICGVGGCLVSGIITLISSYF